MSELKAGDYVTWKSVPYMSIGYSGGSDEPPGHIFESDGMSTYIVGKVLDNGLAYVMDLEELEGIVVKLAELRLADPDPDCHSRVGESWFDLGPSLACNGCENVVWFTPEDQQ